MNLSLHFPSVNSHIWLEITIFQLRAILLVTSKDLRRLMKIFTFLRVIFILSSFQRWNAACFRRTDMNLSCFDSVQHLHPGGSLHRKAAVEGECRKPCLHLNIREPWSLNWTVEFEALSALPGGTIFLKLFSKTDWLADPPQTLLRILNDKMGN